MSESTLTEDQFQAKVLGGLEAGQSRVAELATKFTTLNDATTKDVGALKQNINELTTALAEVRKSQLPFQRHIFRREGEVSEDCARFLGAVYCAAGVRQGYITDQKRIDTIEGIFKEVAGVQMKTALSASDIPLPTLYSGEVVELVSAYGVARRYGTVFPLGSGSVKLPYLSTDPTFTINAISAAITEKSPALTHVTFTPEKFGGLIRLPTEIDEDSITPMGQFLARWAARGVARSEDHNFFMSTGTVGTVNGDVEGLAFSTITNSKVTQMSTGNTKYSQATLAYIRGIRALVDAPAIGMGAYYMHPSFEQFLSGLNTAGDHPYNANGVNGAMLDGFPIRWVDVMPAYSTSANVSKVFMLFGDASLQYLGIRRGIAVDTSREAGFTTDEILVRALERFTIGLMALGAVSGLETAAS